MNDTHPKDTDGLNEYERFEQAAKKLFSLTPEEIQAIKQKEKELGIEPDPQDFEPNSDEPESD